MASGFAWSITTQNPPGFFVLTGAVGSQSLALTDPLPTTFAPGTYSVTLSANTNVTDAGELLVNTATINIQIGSDAGPSQNITSSATASVAICIHKSSMIKLANGHEIEISKLKPGQEIMCGNGEVSALVEVVPCWISDNNKICGKCIIFEKDSLGPGIPSKRFAVDSGHPISIPSEYKKLGKKSLRPAKSYLNKSKKIYATKWDMVGSLLPGENRRYDIIMKDNSCKAYIANGIIVQARQNRKMPGYNYQ